MSKTILFTAQLDESIDQDGSIMPTDPSMAHSDKNLVEHISRKSNSKITRKKTPYISLSREITAPLMKFSYGRKRGKVVKGEKGQFKVNRNEVRARIFMVVTDGLPEAKSLEEEVSEPTIFRQDTFSSKLSGMYANASKGDQEDVIYGRIDSSRVFEIHPVLADILFKLTSSIQHRKGNYATRTDEIIQKYEELYQRIIDKIISGEYSVENFNKILDTFKVNDVEQRFIDEFYKKRTNIADSCMRAIPDMEVPDVDWKRDERLALAGSCLRNQVLNDIFPQLLERDFPDADKNASRWMTIPFEEDVYTSTKRSTTGYIDNDPSNFVFVPGQLLMGPFTGDYSSETCSRKMRRNKPIGMEFVCDDSGRVVSVEEIYEVIKKEEKDNPKRDKVVREVIWQDERDIEDIEPKSDDLPQEEARPKGLEYIKERERELAATGDTSGFIRPIKDSNGQFATFDEEGYCLIIKKVATKDGKGSEWAIVEYMMDENNQRTKFDKNGRGTDVDGFDRSGTNRWGMPSGLTIDSVSEMKQEDVDARMREAIEKYMDVPGDALEFDGTPVERMLSLYVSLKAEPDMTEDKIYEKMIYRLFGEKNRAITDKERDVIKKIMRSTIRISKEFDEDIRAITDKTVEEKRVEIAERIRIARNLTAKGKKVKDKNIQVDEIIAGMEDDFEEDIDGK